MLVHSSRRPRAAPFPRPAEWLWPAGEARRTRGRSSGQFDEPAKRRIAGSLAPIIALWLLHRTGSTLGISIYVALACVISVIAALTARETSGESFATIDAR